jgi:site-specific recombinase XerD
LQGEQPTLEVLTVTLWERFIQERVYLKGVSPATVRYYRWVERAFRPILDSPTQARMLDCVQTCLAGGLSPISMNTYLRGFKAYCLWLKAEGQLKEIFKVHFLKTEQKVLATLSREQVKTIIAYKPTGTNMTRAHIVACVLLDTGLRTPKS